MSERQTLAIGDVPTAVGVDMVDVARLRRAVDRWGEDVLARLFTRAERAACLGAEGTRWDSLAGQFAAKEATKKVLGSRGHAVGWTDVEVGKGAFGEPVIRLHGQARAAAERCGFESLLVSISHDGDFAIAIVVAT